MTTVIFQAAKLGDIPKILAEVAWARNLLKQKLVIDRVYGVSGGSLVALAFSLVVSATQSPDQWGMAQTALDDLERFLHTARSRQIRSLNTNPWYGPYNLKPLLRWASNLLQLYASQSKPNSLMLSQLPVKLYLCAMDQAGTFTLFGAPNPLLKFQYHAIQVGPPQDAPILDALLAALSTLLSTNPATVNGAWYRDCRPAVVDASAIVFDLHQNEKNTTNPETILRVKPFAPIRGWQQDWITSSFIMHSQNERNQTLLAAYYLDLQARQFQLETLVEKLRSENPQTARSQVMENSPTLSHVDLPYVGSTEAFTNMRQSVENKAALMARFRDILDSQLEKFPFEQAANVIYGAGGFSGILAGLVTTRAVDVGFEKGGGKIQQIYGVSAGVLNGFFHAVQIAAARHPDIYKPAAHQSLTDLEDYIASITPQKIARINRNPARFWRGWANLGPLREFLLERLASYTGSKHPEQITFDDIDLPMTIAAARLDGFTDFLGMTSIDRRWHIGGREWRVLSFPIVDAILAGWSMNTYILPTQLADQTYADGGGTFYDPALFVACMDSELTTLINIHLDEPDGHSYNLPTRPDLLRILFDTHNYYFPEERRRMRALTDLLYQHYALRVKYQSLRCEISAEIALRFPVLIDFRRTWEPEFALPVDLT